MKNPYAFPHHLLEVFDVNKCIGNHFTFHENKPSHYSITFHVRRRTMALNLEAAGQKIGPVKKDYNWKDVILYALGVGAGFDEIEYVYEKDLKVIPSFGIAAIFEFLSHIAAKAEVNYAGILHGEQELIYHSPIPIEGTMVTEGKITDFYDMGKDKGAIVVGESVTCDEKGKRLFTSVIRLFCRLDGGFGGKPAPAVKVEIPDRAPDFEDDAQPSPDQPLLYRLSGDVFQLHVDPEFAKMSGFEMPIMHGLCTHGYACRSLIKNLIPGEPERVHRYVLPVFKPLYPGDPIKTQIWKVEDGKAVWRTDQRQNRRCRHYQRDFRIRRHPQR
jgi:acyl dehydratase